MKLIIHVGTPKTGSTAIRMALQENRDWLAERGVHALVANATEGVTAKHKIRWEDPNDPGWDRWRAEIAALPPSIHTLVISNERMFRLEEAAFRGIRAFFDGMDVKVVVYVREQAQYMQSVVLHNLRSGKNATDLRSPDLIALNRARELHDYCVFADRYERVFGPDAVRARVFDRAALKHGNVVNDFFSVLGIDDMTGCEIREDPNASLTVELADIWHRRREELQQRFPPMLVRYVTHQLAKQGVGEKYFLTEAQVQSLRAEFADSNRRFAERYLGGPDAWPNKKIWTDAPLLSAVDAIEARLVQALEWAPLLRESWGGRRDLGERMFLEGWRDTQPEKLLRPAPVGSESRIRFYLWKPLEAGPTLRGRRVQVRLDFAEGAAAYAPEVALNGRPLGRTPVTERPIEAEAEAIGPLGEIELTLSNGEAEAAPAVRRLSAQIV